MLSRQSKESWFFCGRLCYGQMVCRDDDDEIRTDVAFPLPDPREKPKTDDAPPVAKTETDTRRGRDRYHCLPKVPAAECNTAHELARRSSRTTSIVCPQPVRAISRPADSPPTGHPPVQRSPFMVPWLSPVSIEPRLSDRPPKRVSADLSTTCSSRDICSPCRARNCSATSNAGDDTTCRLYRL